MVKTELIQGIVIDKMSKSPLHEYLIEFLLSWLRDSIPPGYILRKEGPLTLKNSEPEPDISVVKGALTDYRTAHSGHAKLIIEIAVSSLAIDREKVALYACGNISHYWLVNVARQEIEHYYAPHQGVYQQVHLCRDNINSPFDQQLSIQNLFHP